MPAAICHHLHARAVLETVEAQQLVSCVNTVAFDWGAQGPDFFFCHRFLPWMRGQNLREAAGALHRCDPNELIAAMKRYAVSMAPDGTDGMTLSYFLGFLCHYSFDSTAHPYINYLAEQLLEQRPNETKSSLHTEIESALDTILLRQREGKLTTEFDLGSCFPKNRAVQKMLGEVYETILREPVGIPAEKKLIEQAAGDASAIFSLLNDKTALKKKLVAKLEGKGPHAVSAHIRPILEEAEIDFANTACEPWPLLSGEESRSDFFQLERQAEEKALGLIRAFLAPEAACGEAAYFAPFTKNEPFG